VADSHSLVTTAARPSRQCLTQFLSWVVFGKKHVSQISLPCFEQVHFWHPCRLCLPQLGFGGGQRLRCCSDRRATFGLQGEPLPCTTLHAPQGRGFGLGTGCMNNPVPG
jgi:hypothetical protein